MKIIAISGSASKKSGNYYLLKAIQKAFKEHHEMTLYDSLSEFPLFSPPLLKKGIPPLIQEFKALILAADAVVISTPEYTHNIPAVLKNMIEWCTHSGEFVDKNILPITFTPSQPRGEYAMQSLLFSLKAINANPVTQLPLFKTEETIQDELILLSNDSKILLKEALDLL